MESVVKAVLASGQALVVLTISPYEAESLQRFISEALSTPSMHITPTTREAATELLTVLEQVSQR